MRFIVIDPEEEVCEALKMTIEEEKPGWTVDCANSSDSARQFLSDNKYDVIIIDHYFSTRNNIIPFLETINIPLIILSSWRNPEIDFQHIQNKVILKKPFNLDDFDNYLLKYM